MKMLHGLLHDNNPDKLKLLIKNLEIKDAMNIYWHLQHIPF